MCRFCRFTNFSLKCGRSHHIPIFFCRLQFGQKSTEGCCWWGRGAFPRGSAGTCMIGRLNYYLGKRAFDEGRTSAKFKDIDFCKDPSAVCRGPTDDGDTNAQIRWLMGMAFWINKVQSYNQDGWSYLEKLHAFTDGGMGDVQFLEDVSRIVTRGCHDQSNCGHAVSSNERLDKFNLVMSHFGKGAGASVDQKPLTQYPSKRPTTSEPTSKPTTPAPTYMPTEAPMMISLDNKNDEKIITQNYCGTSENQMKVTCSAAPTCNDDDGPCPKGMFCFGNHVCDASLAGENSMQGPTATQIYPPTDQPSMTPLTVEVNGVMITMQNYCSQSSEMLASTCAWAPTCNGGDMPCPKDTFCFPNVLCESKANIGSPSIPTLRPASLDSVPPSIIISSHTSETTGQVSEGVDDYQLTSSELAQRLKFASNYCAHSLAEVEEKCASTLRTW